MRASERELQMICERPTSAGAQISARATHTPATGANKSRARLGQTKLPAGRPADSWPRRKRRRGALSLPRRLDCATGATRARAWRPARTAHWATHCCCCFCCCCCKLAHIDHDAPLGPRAGHTYCRRGARSDCAPTTCNYARRAPREQASRRAGERAGGAHIVP